MNSFDKRYEIKLAETSDIEMIMDFIRNNWSPEHILGNDRQFFEYEHVNDNQVNFVIAVDRETKQLEGIYGFLMASQDQKCMDVWGVMWMVRENGNNLPFLGVELIKRLKALKKCRNILGIGSNPETAIPILKLMLKYHTGKMEQYYRLNPECKQFRTAVIQTREDTPECSRGVQLSLRRYEDSKKLIEEFPFEKWKENIPYKDSWYMEHRFFQHPVYKYEIFGVVDCRGTVQAIMAGRRLKNNDSEIFRIVDYIGNMESFGGLYDELGKILKSGVEYIDFYCRGLNPEALEKAGFVKREDDDVNIIPNYFEPFVQKNVDIYVDWPDEEPCFFKADGDQDRPSRIRRTL